MADVMIKPLYFNIINGAIRVSTVVVAVAPGICVIHYLYG